MFLAPTFLSQGDLNHDGRLSKEEFAGLAEKWFAAWDTNKTGRLDLGKIRAGLNATLAPPGGPGRPGGPGGPGGRGPGLMLQGPEGKRNGLASAMGIEFVYVHADLEFDGQLFKDVAVRYKGNGTFMESRGSLKRSLKIELNKYVKGQKLAGQAKLNLHNNVTDASWMNEPLSYRLYRDAGVPAPRTSYARVFLTVPGKYDHQYVGLYSLVEEVDKAFVEQHYGTRRGALLKPVTPSLFADLGPDWSRYRQTYDPKTPLFSEQSQQVIDFCRLLTHADDAQFAARLGEFIDLEEFARFMAVMVWLSDMDGILGPGQNLYVYMHPKSQLLEFIPWDQDHSFGQFPMRGTQEQRENLSIHKPWDGENRFLERVFKVEAFKKLYSARLAEFSESIFKPERLARQVDEITPVLRLAVQEESETKLERFDKAVAGEILPGRGFGPIGGGPGITPIKPFAQVRSKSVRDQVKGQSTGQTVAGFGFPGGGPGGPPRGPGGPGGFGPGMFLGNVFLQALDQNKDSVITRDEFLEGFAKWFAAWNKDHSGVLTDDQLRAGIDEDLSPFRGGPPPGIPGPGPGDEKP
jgi:spore coat protein H